MGKKSVGGFLPLVLSLIDRNEHFYEVLLLAKNQTYVDESMIRKNSVEYRAYQVNLAEVAARESTMIVLSTGLGKTVIAALVAAKRLYSIQTQRSFS